MSHFACGIDVLGAGPSVASDATWKDVVGIVVPPNDIGWQKIQTWMCAASLVLAGYSVHLQKRRR